MCGIGGWFCWGEDRPSQELVKRLLLANEARGTDASGLAWIENNEIYYKKAAMPAKMMVDNTLETEWASIAASPLGLIHARAKTKGDAKDNVNNHPVIGLGWVVVHNGNITNDDDLFAYYKTERFADVDTAALPLVLSLAKNEESLTEIIEKVTILSGSATFAAWSMKNTRRLLVGRLGFNDLYMFLDVNKKLLFFSSAASFAGYLPAFNIGGMRFLTLSRLEENRVIVLDQDFAKNRTFKVTRSPFTWVGPKLAKVTVGTPTEPRSEKTTKSEVVKDLTEALTITITDAASRTYQCIWGPTNAGKKPRPDLSRATFEPTFLASSQPTAKDGKRKIQTPYGVWSMYKGRRSFRPRRSVSKWWRREFETSIYLTGADKIWDHKLCLEAYSVRLLGIGNNAVRTPGYMCPWCGITSYASLWETWLKWRCEFCGIASRLA